MRFPMNVRQGRFATLSPNFVAFCKDFSKQQWSQFSLSHIPPFSHSPRQARRSILLWLRLRRAALIAIYALLLAGRCEPASAETAKLVAVADTGLRSSEPNNNLGGRPNVPLGVGGMGGSVTNRGLFRFDLTALPVNAQITNASLQLIAIQGNGSPPASFQLHRVLKEWREGNKSTSQTGQPASDGEATWNARLHPAPLWASAGGGSGSDFVATASASGTLGIAESTNVFNSAGLVADVQLWAGDFGTNFGWILIASNESSGGEAKLVGSRESPSIAPILVVQYSLPGPPAQPPNIFGVGLVGNAFLFSFNAESNRSYTVESKGSLAATNWSMFGSFPTQAVATTISITNAISTGERYFRVATP